MDGRAREVLLQGAWEPAKHEWVPDAQHRALHSTGLWFCFNWIVIVSWNKKVFNLFFYSTGFHH